MKRFLPSGRPKSEQPPSCSTELYTHCLAPRALHSRALLIIYSIIPCQTCTLNLACSLRTRSTIHTNYRYIEFKKNTHTNTQKRTPFQTRVGRVASVVRGKGRNALLAACIKLCMSYCTANIACKVRFALACRTAFILCVNANAEGSDGRGDRCPKRLR